MRRSPITTSLAGLCLLLAAAPAATATSLVRIETQPVNGAAIITEEAGVRVIRPLPPLRYMIVNPDGRTPLNLTIEDRNVFVQHHHYGSVSVDTGDGGDRYIGGYGLGSPGVYRHRLHRHVRRLRPGGYMVHVPSAARR